MFDIRVSGKTARYIIIRIILYIYLHITEMLSRSFRAESCTKRNKDCTRHERKGNKIYDTCVYTHTHTHTRARARIQHAEKTQVVVGLMVF